MAGIGVVKTERGIQVLFDRVGPSGPQIEYGLIDFEEGWIGLSDTLVRGQYNSMDRSEESGETMMVVSSSDGWQIRALIDDEGSNRGGSLSDQLRSSLGLDQESFEILVIGVALAVLILGMVTLVGLSAQGVRWVGRRSSIDEESNVVMEDDVVDLVDESDLSIGPDEIEIVHNEQLEEFDESGRESRKARRERRKTGIAEPSEPADNQSIDSDIEVLDSPPIGIANPVVGQISCYTCGSKFVTEPGISSTKCPVCNSKIEL